MNLSNDERVSTKQLTYKEALAMWKKGLMPEWRWKYYVEYFRNKALG